MPGDHLTPGHTCTPLHDISCARYGQHFFTTVYHYYFHIYDKLSEAQMQPTSIHMMVDEAAARVWIRIHICIYDSKVYSYCGTDSPGDWWGSGLGLVLYPASVGPGIGPRVAFVFLLFPLRSSQVGTKSKALIATKPTKKKPKATILYNREYRQRKYTLSLDQCWCMLAQFRSSNRDQ